MNMTDFRKYPPPPEEKKPKSQPIYVKKIDEDNVGYESDVYFDIYGD